MMKNLSRWTGGLVAGFAISLAACAADKLPQWMVSPPADDGQWWYGTGEGPDLEGARRNALRNVAAKLRSTIAGQVSNTTSVSASGGTIVNVGIYVDGVLTPGGVQLISALNNGGFQAATYWSLGQVVPLGAGTHTRRQDGQDLAQCILGLTRQRRVQPSLGQPHRRHQGFGFVLGKHQRWQLETLAQTVAHTGLALNGHALVLEVRHVAVDGARGHLEAQRERVGGEGSAGAAQVPDDLVEALGSHGGLVPASSRTVADNGCQQHVSIARVMTANANETLTLLQYAPAFGMRNASPFCVKADALLAHLGQPYEKETFGDPRKAPKGKLPVLRHRGQLIADSSIIRRYLEKTFSFDFDAGLSDAERATSDAFVKLCEEHLYWVIFYSRWMEEKHWPVLRDTYFAEIPALLRPLITPQIRKGAFAAMQGHGLGRHTRAEIYEMGVSDVLSLSRFLGDKPFFMGPEPTKIDATVHAFVCNLLAPQSAAALAAIARRHRIGCCFPFSKRVQ